MTEEEQRLLDTRLGNADWKLWGPYLSERAWGTVREDYSADGSAWTYFPHDQARSRAYRWNEDGLAGICNAHQRICLAFALWNERDPILKERLFGLSGPEGNHGEDVKECYYYLDSAPTHSYLKTLYKYPHAAYPYHDLVQENGSRDRSKPEYELMDTGVFAESRYHDVLVEYCKAAPDDILVRVTIANHGPAAAPLHLLPTIWFRNRWSWGYPNPRPLAKRLECKQAVVQLTDEGEPDMLLICSDSPDLLFTENDTNNQRLFNSANPTPFVKDAFNRYVVEGEHDAVNSAHEGTKAAAHYTFTIPAGGVQLVKLRLRSGAYDPDAAFPGPDFDDTFARRMAECDTFYKKVIPAELPADGTMVMRQALAGMLFSKQYYHFGVEHWLDGDPAGPPPPAARKDGRNHEWRNLYSADLLSMPDKWEYPWFAAWDLAFHCIALALVDSDFAKDQLVLILREWYQHPNGQLPAYEWAFSDVNAPVHAWAALRVYQIERKRKGKGDRRFLERIFHKLLLNFTWWVNRKDAQGLNIFEGGFLGLDNIGVFDRSAPLPTGGFIEQSDGTSWMAMYALNMLAISFELALEDPVYEDVASKFWEHFLHIAFAMNHLGGDGIELWDTDDCFFYDVLNLPDGRRFPLRLRSMVGIIPLFAVETMDSRLVDRLPGFKQRSEWVFKMQPALVENVACMKSLGLNERRLLSIVTREQLAQVLAVVLDEQEFLSPYGIRSVSQAHRDHPYVFEIDGTQYSVKYEPGMSTSGMFGGNSNWRGPVWFPVNYLLIESLQKYHYYFGDTLKVECPRGSGIMMNLWEVSMELSRRLTRLFLRGEDGKRPIYGDDDMMQNDPNWRDLVLFHEYFHGDNGLGLGASHQTGWTGLVAKLLQQSGG